MSGDFDDDSACPAESLHLTGLAAMSLASQWVDYFPLTLPVLETRVGHGRFRAKEIAGRESEILNVIGHDMDSTTVYDFLQSFVADFENKERNEEELSRVRELATYLCMMAALDYTLLVYKYEPINKARSPAVLAAGSIYLAVMCERQLNTHDSVSVSWVKMRQQTRDVM